MAYELLFSIPLIACALTGTASIMTFELYMLYIDVMNNMGHCNFELVPTWLFRWFPPLKYIMYTPSYVFSYTPITQLTVAFFSNQGKTTLNHFILLNYFFTMSP
jgi:hypothetical protein